MKGTRGNSRNPCTRSWPARPSRSTGSGEITRLARSAYCVPSTVIEPMPAILFAMAYSCLFGRMGNKKRPAVQHAGRPLDKAGCEFSGERGAERDLIGRDVRLQPEL